MASSHSRLFYLACKAIKYFLIGLFGVGVIGFITAAFGLSHLFFMLLPCLWDWLLRLGVASVCLFATAAIAESLSS